MRSVIGGLVLVCGLANATPTEVKLGEMLFFDTRLSKNQTESCATCHNPNHAFVDDRNNTIDSRVSLGDDGKSLGDRNAPSAAYAALSPEFHYDKKKKVYKGGQFWDGREKHLSGQAGGPPLNPIEMGMSSKEEVINRLKADETYVALFSEVYGKDIFKNSAKAYEAMTKAIAAFESTKTFSSFDSKYDKYLRGEYQLTAQEELGKSLFFSNNNTNCATCHVLKGEDKEGETFTNYEYHNIGVPSNPFLAERGITKPGFVDKGLANNPNAKGKANEGKFKVPSLRNVAVTGPYMHNGVFKDLRTVILFYDKYNNTARELNPETNTPWGEPEVEHSISKKELKAKRLSEQKVDALIAFLKLLTDERYEHLLH